MVRSPMRARHLFLALPGLFFVSSLVADERVNYEKQIKPIFSSRCVACHGALKQESGLRLDTAALAIKGGESGAAIIPGEVAASLLLKRVTATEESQRMPPDGESLKPEQIAAIRDWITQNAEAPADERPERHPREHWAFRPVVRPVVPLIEQPSVQQARWQRNPIDAFIAREHRQRGITPQPEADRRVWLRRVSLDFVGLPPTPAELDAFVADQSPDAHETVVARLLESPRYGQRWGRHWMDIWRYSDWWGLGAEVRNSQKHIWHWRDWIIESLNSDKGYDQMLREMLAADELYPNDFDRLRATGYLARQYFIFNRTTWLDETIEHTAKGMLGLTFNCAKCHDHKYDPLSQVEYYQLRAIFEPYQIRTEMVSGQIDFEKDGIPRVFDAHLEAPTYLHVRGDDRNPDKSLAIAPAVPAFLTSDQLKLAIEPVALPPEATYPGLREFVVDAHRKAAMQQIAAARSAVDAARKKLLESETAEKVLAAKASESKSNVPAESEVRIADALAPANAAVEAMVRDDFSSPKPEVWETLAGQWSYANGRLVQSQAGSRAAMRLKQLPPDDFEARLKYLPTGGDTWKSVGISCDVTAEGNELLAYVSAVSGGSRSQIAYRQDGNYVYPSTATQARNVELDQPHEIVLRVRGTLLNMSVDGEHSIAFRLPNSLIRHCGRLELIAFDAKVEFIAFELRPLATELTLVEANAIDEKSSAAASAVRPAPVDQARLGVTIAEKVLVVAEAQLVSIEARAAAGRALFKSSPPVVQNEQRAKGLPILNPSHDAHKPAVPGANDNLILNPSRDAHKPAVPDAHEPAVPGAAGRSELVLAAARADEELSRAELLLLQAAADKKDDAAQKLAAAKSGFEAACKAIDAPRETYTPLPGAKKTQEDYQNRNADKPFPSSSTGRRTAFAKWLTDPGNPLPARVAVNHIWMRHMGKPLVPTVFDFGRKGTPPTHPELLDWLASELVEHNWSMKHIHRLIVTSEAYRLSSSSAFAADTNLAVDPDNRFYWRMNPVRMDSQILRDSLLSMAGEIDLSLGGPPIAVNDEASRRRSLYFVHSHNDHQMFLATFDDASVLDCYRRAESIVPQQALALENSLLATMMAGKITQSIVAARPDTSDVEFLRTAFVTILSVEPSSEEQAAMSEIVDRMTELARTRQRPKPELWARTSLVQTLINHNDFITIR